MFDVILYEPEIPPNTGNIMRLCANTGARLHLVEPLGFRLDDRLLRRAGLDYREWASVQVHASLDQCLAAAAPAKLYACSTRGTVLYAQSSFHPGDGLLFGPETRGLPTGILNAILPAQRLFIPMRLGNRSLNLSNAVTAVLYEAWRQNGFAGAARG
jgi:tRNA (cytidine/uridine-2'-O-)-methyltransferase